MSGGRKDGAEDAALALQALVGAASVASTLGGPENMMPSVTPRAYESCGSRIRFGAYREGAMPTCSRPSNGSGVGPEAEKRRIRLEKNRIAAKESRKRKKQHTGE